jgi:uncharacterized protein (DUF885 family)
MSDPTPSAASSPASRPTTDTKRDQATERAWTSIDRLADEWVQEIARLSPTFAAGAGLPGDPAAYDDYSPAGMEASRQAGDRILARLKGLTPQDAADTVTKRALLRDLELGDRLDDSGWWLRSLNNLASPAQGIRDVFDNMPTDTATDWETIAARLHNLPAALQGYQATLDLGRERGLMPAARQVRIVAAQIDGNLGADGFFSQLAERAAAASVVPAALADRIRTEASGAQHAYAGFQSWLRDNLLPVAPAADAVGRDWYTLLLEYFAGAKIDPDETYEWGLDELARVTAEQEACAAEIVPGGGVPAAIEALEHDPHYLIHGTDALREWMQQLADTAVTELSAEAFDIPQPVRTIQAMIAPTQTGGIYYTGPNDDFSRPGRMWWSVAPGVTTFHTWRETTTVYHEGVPGHHLQIGTAVACRGQLNTWRRLAAGTSGFWEGWALYAERLMDDLGYLRTPGERLGMLDAQRMRAARVALDIGVHLGKQRPDGRGVWDADYAFDFFRANVRMEETPARFEVDRYLGWPGQAPCYKVGERVWMQVRDHYLQTRPGSQLVDFHREALRLGNLGLDDLRAALE